MMMKRLLVINDADADADADAVPDAVPAGNNLPKRASFALVSCDNDADADADADAVPDRTA